MASEPDVPPSTTPPRPTLRGAAMAGAYGAVVASLAYVIGRGNPLWMLVVMIVIGVAFRLCAYRLDPTAGPEAPPMVEMAVGSRVLRLAPLRVKVGDTCKPCLDPG